VADGGWYLFTRGIGLLGLALCRSVGREWNRVSHLLMGVDLFAMGVLPRVMTTRIRLAIAGRMPLR
jgi:hypothetical protein